MTPSPPHPLRVLVNSGTLWWGCRRFRNWIRGTPLTPSRFGNKLPLPLYADVRTFRCPTIMTQVRLSNGLSLHKLRAKTIVGRGGGNYSRPIIRLPISSFKRCSVLTCVYSRIYVFPPPFYFKPNRSKAGADPALGITFMFKILKFFDKATALEIVTRLKAAQEAQQET